MKKTAKICAMCGDKGVLSAGAICKTCMYFYAYSGRRRTSIVQTAADFDDERLARLEAERDARLYNEPPPRPTIKDWFNQ
jgi:hypothetical protein